MTPAQARLWAVVASERPMVVARVKQRVLPHAVDDAVQTVLERAARLILRDRLVIAEGIEARPIVRAWLTSIIRRVCTEVRRTEVAAKRIRDAMAEEVRPTFDPVPLLEAQRSARTGAARAARARLGDPRRLPAPWLQLRQHRRGAADPDRSASAGTSTRITRDPSVHPNASRRDLDK
jgi:DNA-directed RNA polymerase specialized sigma24 family protein